MHNATSSLSPPAPQSTSDFGGLIGLLLSFSAVRDWLKLILMGGVFNAWRQVLSKAYQYISDTVWFSASVDSEDEAYNWIMYWLSKQSSWKSVRRVAVITGNFGLTNRGISVSFSGDDDEKQTTSYMPAFDESYTIWHKGYCMIIRRTVIPTNLWRNVEALKIRILTRDLNVFTDILREARTMYEATRQHSISIYCADASRNWRQVASRPRRALDTIVLDPGIKEELLNDAREFTQSRQWYRDRGIPFRRGYLLYGAPGTGKSSVIQGLAGELGLDVYIISISRAGMDDTALNELILNLPPKCMALMEDIDAAFHHGLTRNLSPSSPQPVDRRNPDSSEHGPRVTLSGLLNALDGIGAQEGRLLYATTNCYEALDPALCRPGRMDIHVEFKLASRYQARELFQRFYMPVACSIGQDDGLAQTEKEIMLIDDSGFSSSHAKGSSDLDYSPAGDHLSLLEKEERTDSPETCTRGGPRPPLTAHEVHRLAAQFADSIQDREFSMASLQGFLMKHKSRPHDAIDLVPEWIAAERDERSRRCDVGRVKKLEPNNLEGAVAEISKG